MNKKVSGEYTTYLEKRQSIVNPFFKALQIIVVWFRIEETTNPYLVFVIFDSFLGVMQIPVSTQMKVTTK